MSSRQISDYFAEPFDLFNISKDAITSEKNSIIFEGGRGTGKTMLLRQFSYGVQQIASSRTLFLDKVRTEKYFGVYFRVDNPLLRSLDAFKTGTATDTAEAIFTHYFELTIFKDYIEVIKGFLSDAQLKSGDNIYDLALSEMTALLNHCPDIAKCSFEDLLQYIIAQINDIWAYQSRKAIDISNSLSFLPSCGLIMHGRLTNEFCKCTFLKLLQLDDINIVLLIDEFENFSISQQRVLNNAMRFTKDYGARLRIGMRPSGFHTFDTLSTSEFIKEGRDYRKVEFGNPMISKDNNGLFPALIKKIAEKRLNASTIFNGKKITDFLGEEEDLLEEAKNIVKNKQKHIEVYIEEINKAYPGGISLTGLTPEEQKISQRATFTANMFLELRDAKNPLYEMENLLLLLHGKSLQFVKKAFEDYRGKIDSDEAKKYSNDFDKKYKLSFLYILCSIYKREKKGYYGFVDYCHLSSGIIGYFLELCRRAFDIAYFRNYPALIDGLVISKEIQTDAAYEYAAAEFDMIKRIASYGNKLWVFIKNIGDVFSLMHRDYRIKYPETNQFPLADSISKSNRDLLDLACMWSLIIKKQNIQSIDGRNKQEIYILNRILAPIFKISYRTRGGTSPLKVGDAFFQSEFDPKSALSSNEKTINKITRNDQLTFLDFLNVGIDEVEKNSDCDDDE